MTRVQTTGSTVQGRPGRLIPYILTLYYVEIIFIMFGLLFIYGRAVSIATGSLLSIFWAYHIIRFHFGNELHRKIQIYVIDLHAAFTAGYLFYCAVHGIDGDPAAPFILAARILILACELPLLWILTGDKTAAEFRRGA